MACQGMGKRGRGERGGGCEGFTIRVSKLCLTAGAQHGADNGQLEAKLVVLHSGWHLEGVIVELAIKAAGHNLNEGGALAHEHVVDQARTMTANLRHRVKVRWEQRRRSGWVMGGSMVQERNR